MLSARQAANFVSWSHMQFREQGRVLVSPAIPTQAIRLFLLDDHALFREGLVRLLAADPEFILVGAGGVPATALDAVRREKVDVLLLDYDLGADSAEAFVEALRGSGFQGK